MEALEDNHEQDFYLFMKDVEDRKKEKERMKMLTYEERMQIGSEPYDENNNN